MSINQDITDRLSRLAAAGQEIAARQEAGLSETPLSALFEEFRGGKPGQTVRIALVGLDADSVPRVLSNLLGQDYPLCRVVIPDRLGYTEIHLQDQGFILENGRERREFEQADSFLKAIEQSRTAGQSTPALWSDPVKLSMQAPAGRSGVILVIPDSLESLSQQPALLSIIATRAGFLVLAGPSGHQLDADARLTIRTLLAGFVGMQCVVTDEAPVAPAARAGIAWLTESQAPYTLPAHFLASPDSPPFLPFLDSTGPQAGFKQYLSLQRSVGQIEETLGLLNDSLQTDLDQLANRARLVESGAAPGSAPAAGPDSRRAGDEIKNRIQEDLDVIKKNREDATRRSLIVDGELYQSLTGICAGLRVEDIEKSPRDQVVKLTLSGEKLGEITAALQQEVKKAVFQDLNVIDETVEATREEAEAELEKALGSRSRLHLEPTDRNAWWDAIVSMAKPEIRYRSEMAATTFAKRFSEARGGLSVVMVAGGLLTGLQAFVDPETLKTMKTAIYSSMIPILLGGLVWTFVSVKKRDRLTLEKELEKLREGVLAELRKVAGELLRIQGSQITALLGRVSKQLNTQAGDLLKKQDEQSRGSREEDARRARERNRGIEQRTREKTQQRADLGRLTASVADIRRLLADWLRTLNAPAAAPSGYQSGMPGAPSAYVPPPSRVPLVPPSPSRVTPP